MHAIQVLYRDIWKLSRKIIHRQNFSCMYYVLRKATVKYVVSLPVGNKATRHESAMKQITFELLYKAIKYYKVRQFLF